MTKYAQHRSDAELSSTFEEPAIIAMDEPPTILQRIANGDRTAVDQCIHRYNGLVFSIVNRYVRDHSMAEDLAQEVFIEIWRNASRFDPSRSRETTFIAMVSRRRAIDALRKHGPRSKSESSDHDLDELEHRGVIDSVVWGEELSQAQKCLEELDDAKRSVLVLNLRDGNSLARIAERLKLPLGTVKSHARRGLINVRRCMGLDPSGVDCEITQTIKDVQ